MNRINMLVKPKHSKNAKLKKGVDKFKKPIYERLKMIGMFYIDIDYAAPTLPETINLENRTYFRYMDRIFSPLPIKELNTQQSRLLCEIRLKFFDYVVDSPYNFKTLDCLSNRITPENREYFSVLDFGCGNGEYTRKLLSFFPNVNVIGADISLKSINQAKRIEDIHWIHIDNSFEIPLEDHSVDYIISLFVMHFNITSELLKELFRILTPEGEFLFNIFNIKYLSDNFYENMNNAGFSITLIDNCDLPTKNINMCARKL